MKQKPVRRSSAIEDRSNEGSPAGAPTSQIVCFWTTPPVIGARRLSQLQDNLGSFDLSLSANHLKALDEASRIDLGFPYDFYAKEAVRAVVYVGMRGQIIA